MLEGLRGEIFPTHAVTLPRQPGDGLISNVSGVLARSIGVKDYSRANWNTVLQEVHRILRQLAPAFLSPLIKGAAHS
jgi:hypothetical protein